MEIRLARLAEASSINDLLNDCARWIEREKGIKQWPVLDDDPMLPKAIAAGELYVGVQGGEVIATMRLTTKDITWVGANDDAIYVHQLAVRRDHEGQGLGREMLNFCSAHAKATDKAYLRLDCLASNTELREYYVASGFQHLRDIDLSTPRMKWTSSLLQRAV